MTKTAHLYFNLEGNGRSGVLPRRGSVCKDPDIRPEGCRPSAATLAVDRHERVEDHVVPVEWVIGVDDG